eukprot:CAMPEP_0180149740 /NCGR_PEP_ID=MMETSP0986-20121125/20994_1 /TAXON_ID=697907 /ORGANISM="non described non described, Strain CCMP2293" /LENGTH=70 /DNA_ID=CAMNT_0022096463 /DNA_START=56 /DNA_END=264 /DNA_ORIENTATION=-
MSENGVESTGHARGLEGNRCLIHATSGVVDLRIQGISPERCQKWMFRVPWRGYPDCIRGYPDCIRGKPCV